MFPFTNSELKASNHSHTKNSSDNNDSASLPLQSSQNVSELFDGFALESITEKVEQLNIDEIRQGDYQFLEEKRESISKQGRLDPKLQEAARKDSRWHSAKQKDSVTIKHGFTGNKVEKQAKSFEEESNWRWGQSPEQRQDKEVEIIRETLKMREMERRNDFLVRQNKELWAKQRSLHVKIEEQYKDLFKYEIEGLQAELLFEKERSDTDRDDYERKIRNYERKIKKLEGSNKKQQSRQSHSNEDAKAKTEEIRRLRADAQTYQKQKNSLLNQITALNAINEEHKNKIVKGNSRERKESEGKHESTRLKLQRQSKAQLSKIAKLQVENKAIKRDLSDSQAKLNQMKAARQKLELQLKKAARLKEESDAQTKKKAIQYQQLMKSNEKIDDERKQLLKNKGKLQKQLQAKNANLESFKRKFEEDIENLKTVQQELKKQEKQIEQLKQQRQIVVEQKDRLQTELEDHRSENRELQNLKKLVSKELSDLSRLMQLPNPTAPITQEYFAQLGKELICLKYFSDSLILRSRKVEKREFLVNILQEFLYCNAFSTQLLYRYDPHNLANFHNYIDNRGNLLLLLELANGTLLAGFSTYPLDPQKIERPGKGLLMSLTDEKVYRARQDPKLPVVTFDNYYYILGNAEIRLKTQEKKMFSNFGIANSTFDNGRDQRTDFLKVREAGNNEQEISSYEFYQLRLDQ